MVLNIFFKMVLNDQGNQLPDSKGGGGDGIQPPTPPNVTANAPSHHQVQGRMMPRWQDTPSQHK